MKDRYLYPAVFDYAEDGINISFPDLPGALSCADTTEEALEMAREVLELTLYGMEEDGEEIPKPSRVKATNDNESVVVVEAYMPVARMEIKNKAVRRNVSLPQWLAEAAEKNKINLSKTLQSALHQQMNLPYAPSRNKKGTSHG